MAPASTALVRTGNYPWLLFPLPLLFLTNTKSHQLSLQSLSQILSLLPLTLFKPPLSLCHRNHLQADLRRHLPYSILSAVAGDFSKVHIWLHHALLIQWFSIGHRMNFRFLNFASLALLALFFKKILSRVFCDHFPLLKINLHSSHSCRSSNMLCYSPWNIMYRTLRLWGWWYFLSLCISTLKEWNDRRKINTQKNTHIYTHICTYICVYTAIYNVYLG